ncbi:hypothetical protein B296_00001782 [Ensete ventricosum]|uniref:Uncharacterized protein n=1 Tax=Ensete ventricosum TaxID=4639 RepID=A0A427B3T5_ENSVE|nr:hypothetical protein B296_00001782 [Ensete ventricosum]
MWLSVGIEGRKVRKMAVGSRVVTLLRGSGLRLHIPNGVEEKEATVVRMAAVGGYYGGEGNNATGHGWGSGGRRWLAETRLRGCTEEGVARRQLWQGVGGCARVEQRPRRVWREDTATVVVEEERERWWSATEKRGRRGMVGGRGGWEKKEVAVVGCSACSGRWQGWSTTMKRTVMASRLCTIVRGRKARIL